MSRPYIFLYQPNIEENFLGFLESEKMSKFDSFQANLVEFQDEKGPFLFVTHCHNSLFINKSYESLLYIDGVQVIDGL